jgi:hypothetical protein
LNSQFNRKEIPLVVGLVLAIQLSVAQSFTFNPSATVNASVRIDTPSVHEVLIINHLATPIEIGWNLISNTLPGGWDYLFLYNGSCCPASGMNPNGVLDTLPGNGQGFLRLQLDPLYVPGIGTLKLWVYETNNPSVGDTVTYIINASSLSLENVVEPNWEIYPNPATDYINVSGISDKGTVIQLLNSSGQLIRQANAREQLYVGDLGKGIYFIRVNENGRVITKKFSH